MRRVLFVSNGHGEAAIADRIAAECARRDAGLGLDHLALVGDASSYAARNVGPRRAMPSGGLIAMANVRNMARDARAGLIGLTLAQRAFLRRVRGDYAAVVPVGDVFALGMAGIARAPIVFVGTAKSVYVAPYGPFERRLLRGARTVFVRDAATAADLARHGIDAIAANAIADLFAGDDPAADVAVAGFEPALALFPGSREAAYQDAVRLSSLVRALSVTRPHIGGALSIAPGLSPQRFAQLAREDDWNVVPGSGAMAFELRTDERTLVRAWTGELGPLLSRSRLVLGQAGTANEAAAAMGVPIVAFGEPIGRKTTWYRRRQQALLGDALMTLPADLASAAAQVDALLDDPSRLEAMSAQGRLRMGAPGAAGRIADAIVASAGAVAS